MKNVTFKVFTIATRENIIDQNTVTQKLPYV